MTGTEMEDILDRWSSQARKGYFEMLLLARLRAGLWLPDCRRTEAGARL